MAKGKERKEERKKEKANDGDDKGNERRRHTTCLGLLQGGLEAGGLLRLLQHQLRLGHRRPRLALQFLAPLLQPHPLPPLRLLAQPRLQQLRVGRLQLPLQLGGGERQNRN